MTSAAVDPPTASAAAPAGSSPQAAQATTDAAPGIPQIDTTKFKKIERPKETSPEDEIRVTGRGRISAYVSYIGRLFNEQNKRAVTIRATGKASSTAVSVAEVVKRRFKGLHQVNTVGVTEIVDEYEPIEADAGLERQVFNRSVTFISIFLTMDESAVDKNAPGYQVPLDESLVAELEPDLVSRPPRTRRSNFRGRGRGATRGRGSGAAGNTSAGTSSPDSPVEGAQAPRSRGRGRVRRGRGGAPAAVLSEGTAVKGGEDAVKTETPTAPTAPKAPGVVVKAEVVKA